MSKSFKDIAGMTGTVIWKFILFFLIVILLCILVVVGYYGYMDTHAAEAKRYLVDKYNLEDFDYICTEYKEYDDSDDCKKGWFKECSTDSNLAFKYVFTKKNKTKITVIEDGKGDFQDDYELENGDPLLDTSNVTEQKKE